MMASDMTPELVVHCGMQKTGSTSLQDFLRLNEDVLEERLLVLTSEPKRPTRKLGRLIGGYCLDPSEGKARRIASHIATLREIAAAAGKPVLISNENFVGATPGRGAMKQNYPQFEAVMQMLAKGFDGLDAHFVFYTRDVSAWRRSLHNQAVKSDRYSQGFEAYLDEMELFDSWDWLSERLSGIIPKERLHIFRLEDEADRSRPGQQLLRLAGLDETLIAQMEPVERASNESLNEGALEFAMQVNQLDLKHEDWLKVSRLLRENTALFAETVGEIS